MSTNKSTSDVPTTRRSRRAAERAARRSSGSSTSTGPSAASRSPVLWVTVGVLVVGVLAVIVLMLASGGLGGGLPPVSAANAAPPPVELRDGRTLGDPAAPVRMELWEDPQCPACKIFTSRIEPLLVAGPIRDGDVQLTYRDFVFIGPESLDAAIAMRVAEDLGGTFWEFRDLLYANQQGENVGGYARDRLADIAELVGLDRAAFLAAMDDPAYAEAVQAETEEGRSIQIASTPSYTLNGALESGVPSWDDMRAQIEAAVAAAEAEG
jgi:protein-disulfide isomerase